MTNEEFRRFVDATKYVTSAERLRIPTIIPEPSRSYSCLLLLCFRNQGNESICATAINGGPMFAAPTGVIPKVRPAL